MPNDLPLATALDAGYARIITDPQATSLALANLSATLNEIYRTQPAGVWKQTVAECRRHRLCQLLLDDPLTRRSFTQPRGYAGDAELLDIIYAGDWHGLTPPPTAAGEAIFQHTIKCRAPAAVRHRRDLLARIIDEACQDRAAAPHILSVACGHLRELSLSRAFAERKIGRFVGLDQDAISLAEVTRSLPDAPVETIPGSIKLLFGGPLAREKFDFIYTAGLYDYLDADFARRLTERLFAMLNPGGRLLVANFGPDMEDVAYMEAFMDWVLIYRDADDISQLASGLPDWDVARREVFADRTGTVYYLQIDRNP